MRHLFKSLIHLIKNTSRIATALEKLANIDQPKHDYRLRGPEEIVDYGARTWKKEQLKQHLEPMGLAPNVQEQVLNAAMEQQIEEESR